MIGLAENDLRPAMMNISLKFVASIESQAGPATTSVQRLEMEELENDRTCPMMKA